MATLSLVEIPEFEQNSKMAMHPYLINIVCEYSFKMTVISLVRLLVQFPSSVSLRDSYRGIHPSYHFCDFFCHFRLKNENSKMSVLIRLFSSISQVLFNGSLSFQIMVLNIFF